jgi:CubicO group peptidase (beta-lactamase class C family)
VAAGAARAAWARPCQPVGVVASVDRPLVPLPPQPADVPWPTAAWPTGPVPGGVALEPLLDALFRVPALETTFAVVVVHRGRLVAERYGGQLEHWDRPAEPIDAGTRLLSWSMAKSVLHAAVGVLVGDGRLAPDERADVPAWRDDEDPRRAITVEHLLAMRDGLDFTEEYVDAGVSDVIEMLFGTGKSDVAAYATARPPAAAAGERFNYSSGTSNVLSSIVARQVGAGDAYRAFLDARLFGPIGMTSARPGLDEAGTWIASSYVYATARDFGRFGTLYLRDGTWDGARLLPVGWVDHGRRVRSVDEEGFLYGAHWWVVGDDHGSFCALGYDGQSILVCPGLDLVVVRLGKTPAERKEDLVRWRADVVAAFATAAA